MISCFREENSGWAHLKNYQLRGLFWDEDLYRSAVINEMIADWTLSAFLTCP